MGSALQRWGNIFRINVTVVPIHGIVLRKIGLRKTFESPQSLLNHWQQTEEKSELFPVAKVGLVAEYCNSSPQQRDVLLPSFDCIIARNSHDFKGTLKH
jgi:hypothetical protein